MASLTLTLSAGDCVELVTDPSAKYPAAYVHCGRVSVSITRWDLAEARQFGERILAGVAFVEQQIAQAQASVQAAAKDVS